MSEKNLASYYAKRAPEYDRIYGKPERQADLRLLRNQIQDMVRGVRVLEIACGTGYWTPIIAEVAESVLATDIGAEVIALAQERPYPRKNVSFEIKDCYVLGDLRDRFDVIVAGFWWSHVSRQGLKCFLTNLAQSLGPGVKVVFFDSLYVEGSSTPISRRDEHGDTYQLRRLDDGSEHEVLKNFPDSIEFQSVLNSSATKISLREFGYDWFLSYVIRARDHVPQTS